MGSLPSNSQDDEDPDGLLNDISDKEDVWKIPPPPKKRAGSFKVSGILNASRVTRDRTQPIPVTNDGPSVDRVGLGLGSQPSQAGSHGLQCRFGPRQHCPHGLAAWAH